MRKQVALHEAVASVAAGEASVLVSMKIDRISRRLLDFVGLTERAKTEGWAVVALDLNVDMTTPAGEMMANTVANFAQFERRLIGERTKAALAVKRAQGVRLGRPFTLPQEVVDRIVSARETGQTLEAIATGLNADSVPTAQGGKWWPATIAKIVRTADRRHAVA